MLRDHKQILLPKFHCLPCVCYLQCYCLKMTFWDILLLFNSYRSRRESGMTSRNVPSCGYEPGHCSNVAQPRGKLSHHDAPRGSWVLQQCDGICRFAARENEGSLFLEKYTYMNGITNQKLMLKWKWDQNLSMSEMHCSSSRKMKGGGGGVWSLLKPKALCESLENQSHRIDSAKILSWALPWKCQPHAGVCV